MNLKLETYNSKLWQNRTEKQVMLSKTTTNWLFNHVYLFITFLIEKLAFFNKQLQGFIIS